MIVFYVNEEWMYQSILATSPSTYSLSSQTPLTKKLLKKRSWNLWCNYWNVLFICYRLKGKTFDKQKRERERERERERGKVIQEGIKNERK